MDTTIPHADNPSADKFCRYCNSIKPSSDFYPSSPKRCKKCYCLASKALQEKRKTNRVLFNPDGTSIEKMCTQCNEVKPLSDFSPSAPTRCKKCYGIIRAARIKKAKANRVLFNPDGTPIEKTCTRCGELKLLSDFAFQARVCKRCSRAFGRKQNASRVMYKYKLTIEEYDIMFFRQGGVCANCKQPEKIMYKGKPKLLAIDHNHETGDVRELRWTRCNLVLGIIEADPERVRTLLKYLEKHSM